jgi:hypothetical protein
VSVLRGTGRGRFVALGSFPGGGEPRRVAIHDFDRDGRQDVAYVNFFGGSVTVRQGNGHGSLGAPVSSPVPGSPWGLAVADFDEDGALDLATADAVASA